MQHLPDDPPRDSVNGQLELLQPITLAGEEDLLLDAEESAKLPVDAIPGLSKG